MTKSENSKTTLRKNKLSWWGSFFTRNTATSQSFSDIKKEDFDVVKSTLEFIRKYRKTFESLAKK